MRKQSVCTGFFHSVIFTFDLVAYFLLLVCVAYKCKWKQCIKSLASSGKCVISCCINSSLLRVISRSVTCLCTATSLGGLSVGRKSSHSASITSLHRSGCSEDLGKRPLKNFADVAEDIAMAVLVPCPSSVTCLIPTGSKQ